MADDINGVHTVRIAHSLGIQPGQAAAAARLFDEGATVPFIARYRKEQTGGLDEEQLRQVQALLEKLRVLDERRATVLATIAEQGSLTPALRAQIEAAESLTDLEDLYAPYRPKKRTRASAAREQGLQPLADLILRQAVGDIKIEELAQRFVGGGVADTAEALAGARDIAAEVIADDARVRAEVRKQASKFGVLRVEKIKSAVDERRVYERYYEFSLRVDRLRPHQILAVNRGEREKVLRVRIELAERDWLPEIQAVYPANARSPWAGHLQAAVRDSAERLLLPSIERDVRRELTAAAEAHAIKVFAQNLRALLSQPPLSGRVVLGIDPGFRTGCKLAVVDATGKVLATGTIYPHQPQNRWQEALESLRALVKTYGVSLIAIGNGTASRETEQLVAELLASGGTELKSVRYLITSEAGASVYSASPLARAELPGLDVSLRGAVSIARRVQDPLAELVKIDPKAIGVGLYQHDVDQAELSRALTGVVEDVVHWVGVDLNTASAALLAHVSGIGPRMAETLVAYRDEHGPFESREALRGVPRFGEKTFELSAGFLRIANGSEPLDATAIHPESYAAARRVLAKAGVPDGAAPEEQRRRLALLRQQTSMAALAEALGVGVPTLTDMLDQLARPGRDPREDAPAPVLRSDVLKVEDLAAGMVLKGTVRNVVDFGAFVDIGVKQDGLLHRSQMPPESALRVGDVIEVRILSVDLQRGRIACGWV